MTKIPDVLAALENEQEMLERMLDPLEAAQLEGPSMCSGWSIVDVVLHLAQTEELVVATCEGRELESVLARPGENADQLAARWVETDRGRPPREVVERWKRARRAALEALRAADPDRPVRWIAAPLKPRTLATTRLSEHWIHAQDIADPLGLDHPDDDRLWHLARLAHRTIPYAFMREGRDDAPEVRLELRSPDRDPWDFGPEDAPVRIRGAAGEFCRIAARRLIPREAATIEAYGPDAGAVLELVRLYA